MESSKVKSETTKTPNKETGTEIEEEKYNTAPVLNNNYESSSVSDKLKKTSQFFSRFASSLGRTNSNNVKEQKSPIKELNEGTFIHPLEQDLTRQNGLGELSNKGNRNGKQIFDLHALNIISKNIEELGKPVKLEKTLSNKETNSQDSELKVKRRVSSVDKDRYSLANALSPLYGPDRGVSPNLENKTKEVPIIPDKNKQKSVDKNTEKFHGYTTTALIQSLEEELDKKEEIEVNVEEPKSIASACFRDDNSFITSEKIVDFLGKPVEFNQKCLTEYMNLFDFVDLNLDKAFRKLCQRLYLQAESQVIDRILVAFSQRYYDCNPGCVFGSKDVIHAVTYSLLLLNTDLNMANTKNKMTKNEFVKNTQTVINNPDIQKKLTTKKKGNISIFTSLSRTISESTANSKDSANGEDEIVHHLKLIYMAIKNKPIPLKPMKGKNFSSRRSSSSYQIPSPSLFMDEKKLLTAPKGMNPLSRLTNATDSDLSSNKDRGSSMESSQSRGTDSLGSKQLDLAYGTMDASSDIGKKSTLPLEDIKVCESLNSYPYYMVGVLVRKHLSEKVDKKAANRQWKECWVVVHDGVFRMFKPGSLPVQYSSSSFEISNDEPKEEQENALDMFVQQSKGLEISHSDIEGEMGIIPLRHTLVVPLPPPGYSSSRPHVFALQLYSGAVFLFQAPSKDAVNDWAFATNFWAAYTSKPPLIGGVESMDYGWGTPHEHQDLASRSGSVSSFDVPDDDIRKKLDKMDKQSISSRMLFDDSQSDSNSVSRLSLSNSKSVYSDDRPSFSSNDLGGHSKYLPESFPLWKPPQAPVLPSKLSFDKQLGLLLEHIVIMDKDLASHMENRAVLNIRFSAPGTGFGSNTGKLGKNKNAYHKAFSNWEKKSQFLLKELIKYQTFADVLKNVIPPLSQGAELPSTEIVANNNNMADLVSKVENNADLLQNRLMISSSISSNSIRSDNRSSLNDKKH